MKKQQRFTRSAIALACATFSLAGNVYAASCPNSTAAFSICDEFNGTTLDTSVWKIFDAGKPVGVMNSVTVHDGYLDLAMNTTDEGGAVRTTFAAQKRVKVTTVHNMHPNGQYFMPSITLENEETGQVHVNFKRSQYGPDYCNNPANYDKVILSVANGGSDWCSTNKYSTAASSSLYDKWTTAIIEYDSDTGLVTVDLDGDGTVDMQTTIAAAYRKPITSIAINPFGWWTGHWHRVDSIKIEGSKNTTTSPTQSTNLVDLILSNNRAALNYSTNTLTVPTLDIPQAGSSPLTFSSTWKATNATAPNAVFYLADAQQIANVSSPTATFDPVTFTVSMPNVITSGSNNGTDGLAAQKYQVIVEGSILGLVRMGATTQANCPTQTLSWTVNGQYCSTSNVAGSSGWDMIISSDNGNRGSATFRCTNGQWEAPYAPICDAPTLTCSYPQVAQNGQCVTPVTAVSCPTQTLDWGGYCFASVSAASSGQNTVLSNQSGNGYTGNASFTCSSNGSWSISGTTCNPPVVTTTTCPAQTLPWGGNCSASVPAMSSGQSTNNLPNQLSNGYTGNASFTCSSNGSWSTVSNGCSASTGTGTIAVPTF